MKLDRLWYDPRLAFVGGRWQPCAGGTLPLENPSTGETIGEIGRGQAADIDAAVMAAQAALDGDWGRMPAFERGSCVPVALLYR